jgi:UPF0755 protein
MKPMLRVTSAGIFVLLLTFAIFSVRSGSNTAADYPAIASTQGLPEVIIEIPEGSTGSEIARILFENDVVKSSLAYFRVAVADTRSQKVAPGSHKLTQKIPAQVALDQLLDPKRIPNLIKIYEGAWKSEVRDSLIKYGFTASEVATAFSNVKLPSGFTDSEGLLFPAQYTFAKGTTALVAVQSMIDRFTNDATAKEILQGSKEFSPLALLTIASIVQAEGDSKDFAQVSRVVRNRLVKGMPLQMDSTVHFVKKVRGQIFLSTQSTLLNSPYNTYKRYGLPPGPIGSPGKLAMDAALNPAAGDWLFFITVAPGDTRFTKSLDEFNSWKALYQKNRKAGAFN